MIETKIDPELAALRDEPREAQLDAEAEAAYRAGRIVPHDRVRAWLMKLSKGERVPPPRA